MDRWVCSIHMSSMPQAETLKSKCLQLAAANLSEVQVSPLGSTAKPLVPSGCKNCRTRDTEMIRDVSFFFHISSVKYDRSWGTAICKSE